MEVTSCHFAVFSLANGTGGLVCLSWRILTLNKVIASYQWFVFWLILFVRSQELNTFAI